MPASSLNIKILLIDDHPTTRLALRQLFVLRGVNTNDIYEASDKQEASQFLQNLSVDYVILDLHLKGHFGTEILSRYAGVYKETRFVVYTQSEEIYYLKESLRLGAFSILKKDSSVQSLSENLDRILSGSKVFPVQLMEGEHLLSESKLSERELEVAVYIAQGKSNKEIAEVLNCSDQTVKSHRSSILRKIGVDNSVAASVILVKQGLI